MRGFVGIETGKPEPSFFFGNRGLYAPIAVALVIAFSVELYEFARVQNVWVDESSQLSGITLTISEMLRWLTGEDGLGHLGVPGDRMPPVSYLLDWSWLRTFGTSELGLRLFHSAFVIVGVVGLATIVWRKLGALAATVFLAFVTLSPKLIEVGVEIRAYPIFLAITCAQVVVFAQLVGNRDKLDRMRLTAFSLICLAAIYTHFYGVVSSSAFFFALAIAFIRRPEEVLALVVAFAGVIIGSLGILPFVTAATSRSIPTVPILTNEKAAVQYVAYLVKLFGDSANMVSVVGSVLFLGGTLALFAASVWTIIVRLRNQKLEPFDWLLVVVVVGVFGTILANVFVKSFDALKPSYSCWLFVPLALLVGVGASSSVGFRPWDKVGRILAVTMMLTGAATSTYMFLSHAPLFVHGPGRFTGGMYDGTTGPKAIVYEVGSAWGFSYFPLVFSHKNNIAQYRAAEKGSGLIRIGSDDTASASPEIAQAVASYKSLLVVDVQLRTYRDLRECLQQASDCPRFARGSIEALLIGTGHWQETKVERSFGLYDTEVRILEKTTKRVTLNAIRDQ